MSSNKRHGIMQVKSFVDEKGREVRQFSSAFDKGKDEPFYKGVAIAVIQQRHPNGTPMPPMTKPFEFVFPEGTDLRQAFEIFDEEARKALDGIRKNEEERMAANRVVQARAMPAILGPDGKKV